MPSSISDAAIFGSTGAAEATGSTGGGGMESHAIAAFFSSMTGAGITGVFATGVGSAIGMSSTTSASDSRTTGVSGMALLPISIGAASATGAGTKGSTAIISLATIGDCSATGAVCSVAAWGLTG